MKAMRNNPAFEILASQLLMQTFTMSLFFQLSRDMGLYRDNDRGA